MIILSQVTWLLNFIPTFTWRHDSVLLSLFSSLNRFFPEEGEALYVDLPGKRASKVPQATVSVSILASNICQTGHGPDQRPWDHPDRGHCTLYDSRENLNGATSMARKLNRSSYLELVSNLKVKGYLATLITCDISSLGHSLPVCCKTIQKLFPSVTRSRYSCHVRRSSEDCYLYLIHNICGSQRTLLAIERPLFTWLLICATLISNLCFFFVSLPVNMCLMYKNKKH